MAPGCANRILRYLSIIINLTLSYLSMLLRYSDEISLLFLLLCPNQTKNNYLIVNIMIKLYFVSS